MATLPNFPPKLVVGLGNPGPEYQYTRHNVGGRKVRLLFPTTFMNLSGQSVRAVCDYYQIDVQEILVAHDELDLPVGEMRLKFSGGHGGHNGLRDTSQHMSKDYWRLRIGVDHPGNKKQVSNYLTKNKTPRKEEELILVGIEKVIQNFEKLMQDGYEKTMHILHQKELSPEQQVAEEKKLAAKKAKKEAWLKKKAEANAQKKLDDKNNTEKNLTNKTVLQLALEKAKREEE